MFRAIPKWDNNSHVMISLAFARFPPTTLLDLSESARFENLGLSVQKFIDSVIFGYSLIYEISN